jgi:hypothetical protein
VPTKSIRLSDEEAASLREYVELSGEVEAVALKRAAMRGLREFRLDQAILAYINGRDSATEEVTELADALGDETLRRAARVVSTRPA